MIQQKYKLHTFIIAFFVGMLIPLNESAAQTDWGDGVAFSKRTHNFMMAGIRSGYDFEIKAWSAGAQFRLPIGQFQIIPSGDIFFTENKTDWQINLDVSFNLAMLYGGIGVAYLSRQIRESVRTGNNSGFNYFIGLPLPLPLRQLRLSSYIGSTLDKCGINQSISINAWGKFYFLGRL